MQKRTATGAISSPTAEAGFGANIGAHELAAWADRVGAPAHTPEAQAKSNALAAKGQPFAPGLARFNQSMNRYSDPDDTANDLSTLPTGKWGASAAPQGVQGLGNPASSASPTPPVGQPFAQGAAPPVPPSGRAEARGRIREAIAMQRAYEDDNGTPTDRATFNSAKAAGAAGRSHQRAGHEPARERRLQAGQPALRTQPPAVARRRAAAAAWRAERETARVSDPQGASRCAGREGQPVHGPR